jgi:hypothetical protein
VDARYDEQRFEKWIMQFHGNDPRKKRLKANNIETMTDKTLDFDCRTISSWRLKPIFLVIQSMPFSCRWPAQLKD